MLFSYILKKCIGGYRFTKSQEEINYLMNRDDTKVFENMNKKWIVWSKKIKNIKPGYRNGI